MGFTANDYRKHGMIKTAALGKLQSPVRLVPDFLGIVTPKKTVVTSGTFCTEYGPQTHRSESPVKRFQPVPVAWKESQKGDRWFPLFTEDTQ